MKQSAEEINKLPVRKAVVSYAVPSMVSMLLIFVYNVADTFFIGQTGISQMVAAVSCCTPVFLVFMGLGNLLGTGGSSVISRALGAGRREYARQVCSFCFWASVSVSLVLMVLYYIFMEPILSWVGTSGDSIEYAREYFSVVTLGGPFCILQYAMSSIIRAEGSSRISMWGVTLGAVLNIALDPLLISVFDLGATGAAAATVTGFFAGSVFYVVYFLRGASCLSIAPRDVRVKGTAWNVLSIGFPALVYNMLMTMSVIILNKLLLANGGDTAVAGMGIASKVRMSFIVILQGLATGIQPLLGFNYGQQNLSRAKRIIRCSAVYSLVIGTVMSAVCYVFAGPLCRAFIPDADTVEKGVMMVRVLVTSGPTIGLLFIGIHSFQAMGKALPSIVATASREGYVYLPVLFVMARFGLTATIWAQPISDIVSMVIALIMYAVIEKRADKAIKIP